MHMGKQVLLVDDEANITRSIKRVCRTKKYKVLIASSASAALKILETEKVQVVLSDQLMPDMTGAEFFEEIQKIHPHIVRVLLTGYTAIEGLTNAVNKGAVFRILFKPWDDENLLQTIEDAFDYFEIKDKNKQLTKELQEFNQSLESLVEQKTRELLLHVKRLKVSQKLFDLLPEFAIGISDDLYIVDANQTAHNLLDSQALIGNRADTVLPEKIIDIIKKCESATSGESFSTKTTLLNTVHELTCTKVELSKGYVGYLIYGCLCND